MIADLSSGRLWLLGALAAAYALVRFVEAFGLWRNRAWAKWVAALSGGVYVPFELYEIYVGVSWVKAAALSINVAVVVYMGHSLRAHGDRA